MGSYHIEILDQSPERSSPPFPRRSAGPLKIFEPGYELESRGYQPEYPEMRGIYNKTILWVKDYLGKWAKGNYPIAMKDCLESQVGLFDMSVV